MEAVALYTFRATEGDELSFNKGDMLKVRSHLSHLSEESDAWCLFQQRHFCFFTVSVVAKNFARTQNLQRTMTH